MASDLTVWVLDTSALIEFKRLIAVNDQWRAFKALEDLVAKGRIALHKEVIREVSKIAHPDLPGAWAPGVEQLLRYPGEVAFSYLRTAMSSASEVIDKNKSEEDADPYMLSLGLWLVDQGRKPVVVTGDLVDHEPIRISVGTACERLGLPYTDALTFLTTVGIPTKT